ncbi:MAG: type II toxin-antitoxin system PemK/MazF family toxin [Nanoarchaeota archaeon]
MTSGILYEQGDIILVPFPFNDLSGTKQRPVPVLSNENYNTSSSDVVTCGITSNLTKKKYAVFITQNELEEGRLQKASLIKADKLFTLEKTIIIKRLEKIRTK